MSRAAIARVVLVAAIDLLAGRARAAPPMTTPTSPASPAQSPLPPGGLPPPPSQSYALFRLDPLGIAPEIVEQLERILRVELQRVVGQPLPTRAEIEKVEAGSRRLANCTAEPSCLVPLARALKRTRIIAGNVGGLADSYVVNLKLVDEGGRELRRVSATLRGSAEELIEEVRVAAVRLVAPERLVGGLAILSDVPGAAITLDESVVGRTPLAQPLAGISVGVHKLWVTREGFSDFAEDVPVRFEKTTQVVVRQNAVSAAAIRQEQRRRDRAARPLATRWYVLLGVAATAVAGGLIAGFAIPRQETVNCKTASCR